MNAPESALLNSKTTESFGRLDKDAKRQHLQKFNLAITTYGSGRQEIQDAFSQAKELGFTPVRLHDLMLGIAWFMHAEGIVLPVGKKQKQERGKIIESILDKLEFRKNEEGDFQANVAPKEGEPQNIIAQGQQFCEVLTDSVSILEADSMVLGKVLQRIKAFVKPKTLLAVEENHPGQIPVKGPRVLLQQGNVEATPDMHKKTDHVLKTTTPRAVRFGILRELVRLGQIEARRDELEKALHNREIIALPKFKIDNWPTDGLMASTQRQVAITVSDYIGRNGIICDPQDLKYQTLFRLTTHEVSDVYINGSLLDEYLQSSGSYLNWRNILRLDRQFVQQFIINPDLLNKTIEEQETLIKQRLQNSKLPVERILEKAGIFSEQGWVIQKQNNSVFAAQEEGVTAASALIPLEFKEIDPELAKQYQQDLHYIHTPRADIAFGLYIKGEDLPFSVLALEKIDRPYKQNVLLMQGYDPSTCFDLTRLYSRPGTPGNTSSSMFSLTFNYMRNNYPRTQAIMSAFMPSYATGVSMTSGGFDNPVLVKPLVHTFEEREIDGKSVWEHVTNRRQQDSDGKKVRSKFPLLPTIELMAPLQDPRYAPISSIDDYMVEVI